MRFFLLVACFSLCSASLPAVTYYVSPSGNDNNSGLSTSAPWRTVAKANAAALQPGDTVCFQGGQTFSGTTLNPFGVINGTPSALITYTSYGTGRATLAVGAGMMGADLDGHHHIRLSKLNFTGPYLSSQEATLTYPDGVILGGDGLIVEDCAVTGFAFRGILIRSGSEGSASGGATSRRSVPTAS